MLEAQMEALSSAIELNAARAESQLQTHSSEIAALPVALKESQEQIHALEEQLNGACSSLRKPWTKLEREVCDNAAKLEAVASTVEKMSTQMDVSEARLDAACNGMSSSPIRIEHQLEVSGWDLATSPTTFSEAQGQLATMEERLECAQEALRSQVACFESRLQNLETGLEARPSMLGTMQSQLRTVEERLEEMSRQDGRREAIDVEWLERCKAQDGSTTADSMSPSADSMTPLADSIASHEKELSAHAEALESLSETTSGTEMRVSTIEGGLEALREELDPKGMAKRICTIESGLEIVREEIKRFSECATLGSARSECATEVAVERIAAFQEQLTAVQQAASQDQAHIERRFEAQVSDIIALRRNLGDLTNDVLKTQGAVDAAYAEATRGLEWMSALETSTEGMKAQWLKDIEQSTNVWNAGLSDMVQSTCNKVAESMTDEAAASLQKLSTELHQQCRKWIDDWEVSSKSSAHSAPSTAANENPAELYRECQEKLAEVARFHVAQEDSIRAEIKAAQEQAIVESERLWEAIGAQAGGATECSEALALETKALALETQRQCRTWVDGALRKLEDLALRTKERVASLAAAAEQREERLEARLEAELARIGAPKNSPADEFSATLASAPEQEDD
jgi:hypothetical protein